MSEDKDKIDYLKMFGMDTLLFISMLFDTDKEELNIQSQITICENEPLNNKQPIY